jgi:hypothetical protein
MMPSPTADSRIVDGVQFKVLTQVFPVLRHDAVKPLSNAKLTTVLLEKSIAKGTIVAPDAPPFVADIESMLDEAVETIRRLNDWFHDDGHTIPIHRLLHECRMLAFPHLLTSTKKVQIIEPMRPRDVPHRGGRYAIMAWMIHAIQALPPRGTLKIEQDGTERLRGSMLPGDPDTSGREPRPDTSAPMLAEDVAALADFYGWTVETTNGGWTLGLPTRGIS